MNPFTSAKAPPAMAVLPPDMAVQQQQLDRQKLLADMLRKQSMEPGGGTEMVSGWAVQKSPLEGLSKIAQALGGKYMDKQNDEKQAELTRASGKQLADTLAGYQSDMQGRPAQSFQTGGNEMGDEPTTQNVAAVAPNKQAALARLLQSGNPMLQQLGMQQILKGEEQSKWSTTPHYDQQGNAFILDDRGNKKPLDGVKARDKIEVAPSGVAFNPFATTAGTVFNNPNNLMGIGPDGQPVVNQPLVAVKTGLARAGKPEISVDARNYSTQESEQSKTYGKALGEVRADITKAGFEAPKKIQQLDRLQELLAGVDGGKFAPAGAEVASAAASFGIKIDPKLGNKQAAEALAVEMALAMKKPGSGSTSDKDMDEFIKTVPGLAKTPEGRALITQTIKRSIQRDIEAAKFSRDYAKKNGGTIDDNYFEAINDFYVKNPVVTPQMPATNAQGTRIFQDADAILSRGKK